MPKRRKNPVPVPVTAFVFAHVGGHSVAVDQCGEHLNEYSAAGKFIPKLAFAGIKLSINLRLVQKIEFLVSGLREPRTALFEAAVIALYPGWH